MINRIKPRPVVGFDVCIDDDEYKRSANGGRSLQWNATNNAGLPVSAGILIQARRFQTDQMILLK